MLNNTNFWKTEEKLKKTTTNASNLRQTKIEGILDVRTKLLYNNFVFRMFASNKNEAAEVLMNKAVYLCLPMLDISQQDVYDFWCN